MATKRSPSPTDGEGPPTARAKIDSQPAMEGTDATADPAAVGDAAAPLPAASSSSSNAAHVGEATSTHSSETVAQRIGSDGAEEDAAAVLRRPSTSSGDETDDGEKRQGIRVDELETIKGMYDSQKLFGYVEPGDIVFPYHPDLLDKVILW